MNLFQSMRSLSLRAGLIGLFLGLSIFAAEPGRTITMPKLGLNDVTFQDGKAIWQGDIIVGTEAEFRAKAQNGERASLATANTAQLWPSVNGVAQVPYTLTVTPAGGPATTFMQNTIAQFNSTFAGVIQFVPRANAAQQANFVAMTVREQSFGTCGGSASIGMIGGQQSFNMTINPANCPAAIILHEMGHVVGLFHEQARSDRDNYIRLNYQAVSRGNYSEFDQRGSAAQDIGTYDYGSTMHYGPYLFVRDLAVPNIETLPPGIPIQENGPYSAGDIDSIRRLYGATPQQVTVTSNPPGLKVLVDGAEITTPQTFSWAIGTTHTLDVAPGLQSINEGSFVFSGTSDARVLGRWSHLAAGASPAHTITVTAGDGNPTRPTNAPATTVYTANFIELIPIPQSLLTPNNGTVQISPAPITVGNERFAISNQPITLTATPNGTFRFYDWGPSVRSLAISYAMNPLTFRPQRQGLNMNPIFTQNPITTISSNPPGMRLTVDGRLITAPKNYALPMDPTWTFLSNHTVSVAANQSPQSRSNGSPWFTRFDFTGWSDGGAQTHPITVTAGGSTVTASFSTNFGVLLGSSLECAGTASIVSPSETGYYPAGANLTLNVTPAAGWNFTGWQSDLSGTGRSLLVDGEKLVSASFNVVPAPLTITGISPTTVPAGSGDITLMVTGTGFATSPNICYGGTCRPPTSNANNALTITIPAASLRNAGVLDISVLQGTPDGCLTRSNPLPLRISSVVTPPAPTRPSRLRPEEFLLPDQFLVSPNGAFQLRYQTDGNLVVYRVADNTPLWISFTSGLGTGRVLMQADGNLVILGPENNVQWSSRTNGFANAEGVLQDDGSFVIYGVGANPLWTSRWQQVGGQLTQISVGLDGTVIGANNVNDIWQWNSGSWTRLPGSAPLMAVSTATLSYASVGSLWRWDGSSFSQLTMPANVGSFTWISAASDGTLMGVDPSGVVHRRDAQSGAWTTVATDASRVAVRNANEFYFLQRGTGGIQRVVDGNTTTMPGLLVDISVSATGELWGVAGDRTVYRFNGSNWDRIPGLLSQVAVGSAGNIWALDSTGAIFQWR